MRFDRLMKKNSDVSPKLELLNESREDGRKLRVLHGPRSRVVVLLIEAADLYLDSPTMSTSIHAPSF